MRVLTDKYDLPGFFEELSRAGSRALLIDFDGTLAPFNPDAERVRPYPGVEELLNSLMEQGKTRLVLMTSRPPEDLVPHLNLAKRPDIWGINGLEGPRSDNQYHRVEMAPESVHTFQLAAQRVRSEDLFHRCERRPGYIALNFRGMDPVLARRAAHRVGVYWQELADQTRLVYEQSDSGIELRLATKNKRDAIRAIRAEMADSPVMAYLGDDLTDEDAFRALDDRGLAVLVRPTVRATSADIWIRPPDELLDFLRSWLKAEGVQFAYDPAL